MESQTPKDININLENIQVKIEKYPMAESRNLMEYFVIMGYEETYIQEKIIAPISLKKGIDFEESESKSKKNADTKVLKEFKCRNMPTILSSVSSSFTGGIATGKKIVEQVFPVPPSVYYGTHDNFSHDLNVTHIIFSNIQNDVVNVGYSVLFYENRSVNKLKICIPKAFAIISQYPYFYFFSCICKEILNLYRLDSIQIPIEIQLYNMINYTPAPIHSNIRLSLFPNYELSEIIGKCKNSTEFIELERQKKCSYTLPQLSGYRITDVNFTELFCVLSVETIVEAYLELISGHTIGFFSNNIETLNFTIYIFQQFFSPLAPNETITTLSPTKFFCSENIDQYIVGFNCSYDEIDNKNPFRELKEGEFKWQSEDEEKSDLDPQIFRCDFILDLDKKILKEPEKHHRAYTEVENYRQVQKLNEYFKKIIWSNSEGNYLLDKVVFELTRKLRELSVKLTSYGHNNKNTPPNFFNNTNTLLSRSILEAFYQFNLNIAYIYYLKVSSYDGNYLTSKMKQDLSIKSKEDSGLNDDEYLFFNAFSNSLYCNVLGNFIGGYSENEPKIYKVSKRIFEKILVIKKIKVSTDTKKNEDFDKYYDLIDNIYHKNDTTIDFSFFEFYKYYSSKLENEIFNFVLNNEFVEGRVTKRNAQLVKYNFKYRKIDIDNNLIFKYIYFIKNIPKEIRAKLFEIEQKPKDIKEIIYSKDMSTMLENYFIKFKLIEYKDIIMLSILGIVALTVSKYTIISYISQIHEVFLKLRLSVRKYAEIILSIALRLFSKEKIKNYYIYQNYFSIYNIVILGRKIFLNDELIILETQIQNYIQTITNNNTITNNTINKQIEHKDFQFDYDKKYIGNAKASCYNLVRTDVKSKIKLKIKKKSAYFEHAYSIVKVYEEINKMVDNYYQTLDVKNIPKDEYKKLVVFLIYYCKLFEEDVPKDIDKFLYDCLDID